MHNTWILVADAARARLFDWSQRDAELLEIADYANPEGRSPGQHPVHGRLPRTQESVGSAHHAIEPRTTLREKHAQQFALMLGKVLLRGRLEERYDRLVLMAPPRFMGILRSSLDEQTLDCVSDEVCRDLVTRSPAELRARLST